MSTPTMTDYLAAHCPDQAMPQYRKRDKYAYWLIPATGETFPRVRYAAGSKLKDGRKIDLQTGEIGKAVQS